jgi:hypothetical protein
LMWPTVATSAYTTIAGEDDSGMGFLRASVGRLERTTVAQGSPRMAKTSDKR